MIYCSSRRLHSEDFSALLLAYKSTIFSCTPSSGFSSVGSFSAQACKSCDSGVSWCQSPGGAAGGGGDDFGCWPVLSLWFQKRVHSFLLAQHSSLMCVGWDFNAHGDKGTRVLDWRGKSLRQMKGLVELLQEWGSGIFPSLSLVFSRLHQRAIPMGQGGGMNDKVAQHECDSHLNIVCEKLHLPTNKPAAVYNLWGKEKPRRCVCTGISKRRAAGRSHSVL